MRVDDELAALLDKLCRVREWKKISTLGRRAKFDYRWEGTTLKIRYGENAAVVAIRADQIQSILRRRRALRARADQTSEYTDPKWPKRFDRYSAPYVAAVIAANEMQFPTKLL